MEYEDYIDWVEICFTYSKMKAIDYFKSKKEKEIKELEEKSKIWNKTVHGYSVQIDYKDDIDELMYNIHSIKEENIFEYDIEEGIVKSL